MEERMEEQARIQNNSLAKIDDELEGMVSQNAENAKERTNQIGAVKENVADIKTDIADRFGRLFLTMVLMIVPIIAGLLYIILSRALAGP